MRTPDIAGTSEVKELVARAIAEDIGAGDVTSDALISENETGRAAILARGAYVVAGGGVAALVFQSVDRELRVARQVEDGKVTAAGQTIMAIEGRVRSILAAERVALNFMQRMTGIATLTRRFVELARPHGVDVLDTRKTTPTLRALEKYAVLCGGGVNHRAGLFDRVLMKDNHRAIWRTRGGGSLANAVRAAREKHPGLLIEVEVESEDELRDVLEAKPDWVLLDNMTPEAIARCVKLCGGRCKVEASGGVTLETIEGIAATGVNAVSIGALTHSAPAADLSLELDPPRA